MRKKLFLLAISLLFLMSANAQNANGEKMFNPDDAWKPREEKRVGLTVVEHPEGVTDKLAKKVKIKPSQNKKGKWGFVDDNGKMVIKAKFDAASPFFVTPAKKNVSFCKLNGMFGIMNEDGSPYIDFGYRNMIIVNYSYAVMNIDNGGFTVVLLDETPVTVYYDDFQLVDQARYAIARRGDKWFILNSMGQEAMSCESAEVIGNGMTLVKQEGEYGVLDHHQMLVIPCDYDNASIDNGVCQIGNSHDSFGIISNGKIVVKPDSEKTIMIPQQSAVAYKDADGKCGLVMTDGTIIFENMSKIGTYSESENKYYAGYNSVKMVYDFTNRRIGMIIANATTWLPDGSHTFAFEKGVGRYKAKNYKPNYISKKGRLLNEFSGKEEVRALNDKYYAVCFLKGYIPATASSNKTSPTGIGGSGTIKPKWEVANADGKIITSKNFYWLGEFNANGELPYECFDRETRKDVKGKMKFNGDNVIFLKK